jgi:transcriptional regulator with XRE-family HTH domain
MQNPPEPVGAYLRRLRKNRRLTLLQVEQITHLSTAVLSRLERGERNVTRADCVALSRGYKLSAYESYSLFARAGFLPESQRSGSEAAMRAVSLRLLHSTRFPAALIDNLGNLVAWNQTLDGIWHPPHDRPVHVLDELFATSVRAQLGAGWRPYVARAIWLFAQRSVAMSNDVAFESTIRRLEERYGNDFITLWEEAAVSSGPDASDLEHLGLSVAHESPFGTIRYLMTQVVFHTHSTLELHMHVPLDGENMARFDAFAAAQGPARIYEAPPSSD